MNYDFPVSIEKVAVMPPDGIGQLIELENKRVVMNRDTLEPLSVVSDHYNLVEHKEVVQYFDDCDKLERDKIILTDDGGVMFADYRIKGIEDTRPVELNDVVNFKIRAFNSYNKKTPTGFELSALRLVCKNGLVAPRSIATMSFKHYHGAQRFNFEDELNRVVGNIDNVVHIWQSWLGMYPQAIDVDKFFKKLDMDEEDKKELVMRSYDQNLWNIYNNLTYYVSHQQRFRGINKIANQRARTLDYSGKFYSYKWN